MLSLEKRLNNQTKSRLIIKQQKIFAILLFFTCTNITASATQKSLEEIVQEIVEGTRHPDISYRGNNPLLWAIKLCNPQLVKTLLKCKASPNIRYRCETPIETAMAEHQVDDICSQARKNVSESRGKNTESELNKTNKANYVEIVRLLLTAKANADSRYCENEPLHYAAQNDILPIAELLIEHKAEIDRCGEMRYTPLHFAAQSESLKVMKALLEAKADTEIEDSVRLTPLIKATSNSKNKEIRLLVEAKANVNGLVFCEEFGMRYLGPLHMAIMRENPQGVSILIEAKAKINRTSSCSATPLHYCGARDSIKTTKLLLNAKADVHAQDSSGSTPLHGAARYNESVAKLLIEAKANVNAQNTKDETPLHQSAQNINPKNTDLLIEAKANVNAQNHNGETPLDSLTERNFNDRKKSFVRRQYPRTKNFQGHLKDKKLDDAVESLTKITVQLLLNAKADPNNTAQAAESASRTKRKIPQQQQLPRKRRG